MRRRKGNDWIYENKIEKIDQDKKEEKCFYFCTFLLNSFNIKKDNLNEVLGIVKEHWSIDLAHFAKFYPCYTSHSLYT